MAFGPPKVAVWRWRRRAPSVLPPPQDLPVLRRQRAEDRLQGRQAPAALRLRARQDRAEPHHRGVGQEAARARAGDQARALPRPAALRDPLDATSRRPCGGAWNENRGLREWSRGPMVGTDDRSVSNRSKERDSSMMQLVLIGIGAGAATALLFASVASGSLLSVLLFYLAPLPILIAALGWSHWAALIAAVVASAGLAAVFGAVLLHRLPDRRSDCRPGGSAISRCWRARPRRRRPTGSNGIRSAIWWSGPRSSARSIVIAAMLNFGTDDESFRAALRSGLERMLNVAGAHAASPAGAARRSRAG